MYADDTTLTVSETHANEIKQKLSNGVCQVMNWIDANKLVLNVDKTMVMLIGSRRKLNGIETLLCYGEWLCLEQGQGYEVSWCFK